MNRIVLSFLPLQVHQFGNWMNGIYDSLTIGVAYASFKLYDVPVRRWLTKRFMSSKTKTA